MDQACSLIESFKQTKPLPSTVRQLIRLLNDANSTLQDFEKVIRIDPLLVSRLLTLVNSSFFGLKHEVDSISRAVALLGTNSVHNIAITGAIQDMLKPFDTAEGFSTEVLWLHSSASAVCCKMIAERIFALNGDKLYLSGILHNIGLIVQWQTARAKFLQMYERLTTKGPGILELEQEIFGVDHCRIGSLLTREWSILPSITRAIRDYHLQNNNIIPSSTTGILQLSEYIIGQLGFFIKKDVPIRLSPSLSAHIKKNIEEYRAVADDLSEEIAETQQLYTP
ncbi:MAG: signal transduction protein [Desulfobulbus propionicus]|nr:MAG: signal transduction protein [Desulfobulbus propionicus]